MVSQLKKWNNDLKKTEEFSRQSSYNSVHSNNSTIMHQKRSFKHSDPSSTTMSSIVAHNSMHSLVPMTVFEEKMAAYQSELDDSDDENYMWIPPVDNRNNHSSASTETPTTTPVPDELLIRDALEEIQNFQDNFVQKYNNANNLTSSRVQQKVLDYKELQEYQPETLVNSLDYNMKIQNETLTSQYTLLRLRFNSVNKMGVMGFISGERKWESNVTSSNLVTKENKDSYIQELWNNEMQVFRTPSPILKSTSQVLASSMDDRSIKSRLRLSIEVNANTNDKDDLLNSHGSLSDMAKNIRLNDV